MGDKTGIGWTNHPDLAPGRTWNPWQGCDAVSPACDNCYMFREKRRYGQDPTTVVRSAPGTFYKPRTPKWATPGLVFVCSWSDFWHRDADPWRPEAWDLMREHRHLTYLLLTKRPTRILANLPPDWGEGWPHVWIGVTVEGNAQLGRIEQLRQVPAARRFVSNEPALEHIDWTEPGRLAGINWLITGGESGAFDVVRPWHDAWAREAILAGRITGTAVYVKQRGIKTVDLEGERLRLAPDALAALPDALNVRQWPPLVTP